MKRLWRWIKSRSKKKVSTAPKTEAKPVVVPPTIVIGDDFFTVDNLYQIMKYDGYSDSSKTNVAVLKGCQKYCKPLNEMFKQNEINTYHRICHCLAQVGKESAHLRITVEYGNWWYFFRKRYGSKYKGRGLIQLTWDYHYKSYTEFLNKSGDPINLLDHPDKLAHLPYCVDVVGYYWTQRRKLNEISDGGDSALRDVTLAVNGGVNGLEDRSKLYFKAKKVLANS